MGKKLTKLIALVALLFSYLVPVTQAVNADETAGATNLTIHKIKMNDLTGWPKPQNEDGTQPGEAGSYDGTKIQDIAGYFGAGSTELAGVKFIYWTVTQDQYEKMTAKSGEYDTVEKVEKFLGDTEKKTKQTTNPTTENGVVVGPLEKGFYWFVEDFTSELGNGETLAAAAAVPFGLALPVLNKDGVQVKDLHVYPKNTVTKPQIDKNFADGTGTSKGADYANYEAKKDEISRTVGTSVPYEVKTKIIKGSRYKTLRWDDTMTHGLTYDKNLKVVFSPEATDPFKEGIDYTITQNESGFVLKFEEPGLAKMEELAKTQDVEVTLTYSATINGTTIVDNPEENHITFDYGNSPKNFNEPRNNSTKPKEKRITVTKQWASGDALPGTVVKYFLYEKGATAEQDKVVDTITLDKAPYNHTFEGLDDNKDYYVKELVEKASYEASYTLGAQGELIVTNTHTPTTPPPLVPTKPKVVTGGKRFQKIDETTKSPLKDAEFVITNGKNQYLKLKDNGQVAKDQAAYDKAEQAYQKAVKDKLVNELATLKAARDAAYKTVNTQWDWTDNKDQAHKVKSGENGYFHITGLEYGTYFLEETKAPTGYALLTKPVEFQVAANSMNEAAEGIDQKLTDDKGLQLVNNKKVTIPQTGGIGTAIFTAAGLAIMGFAFVAMKRKKS